jgi:serine/threonine protein kinase
MLGLHPEGWSTPSGKTYTLQDLGARSDEVYNEFNEILQGAKFNGVGGSPLSFRCKLPRDGSACDDECRSSPDCTGDLNGATEIYQFDMAGTMGVYAGLAEKSEFPVRFIYDRGIETAASTDEQRMKAYDWMSPIKFNHGYYWGGAMNLSGREGVQSGDCSFGYGLVEGTTYCTPKDEFAPCGIGELYDHEKGGCAMCSRGPLKGFYNDAGRCELCPIGIDTYVDASTGIVGCSSALCQGLGCLSRENMIVSFVLLATVVAAAAVISLRWYARWQLDSIWKVQLSELAFSDPVEVLGRGTFGLVVKAEYRGTFVAVKRVIPPDSQDSMISSLSGKYNIVNSQKSRSGKFSEWRSALLSSGKQSRKKLKRDFIREMHIMSKLRHPCVLTVMGAVIPSDGEPLLVMELMECGSLYDLLHNHTMCIEGELVLPILLDVVRGLRFLHVAGPAIVHGDLKAQNVLVDAKFRAKIADFGLTQKKSAGVHGTPLWMAPELIRGEPNTTASDVYAFGITLSEVYSRSDPYQGEDPHEVIAAVADNSQNKRPAIPASCPAEMVALMRECWHADSRLRPTCDEMDRRLQSLDASRADPGRPKRRCATMARRAQRTDEILYDIFPEHVANALRDGRKPEPEARDEVTIFFSDIVGFTDISATLAPEKVSSMLDRLYTSFDQLSREHGVFKVETIGDAYMAVSNLFDDQWSDHAKRIALFAISAVKVANETLIDVDDPSRGNVQIRVGFHTGPVVANVVGTRNLRYCLFGDTVNTASRMESNSMKNQIHCSFQAAALLQRQAPEVTLKCRGMIKIKGKGTMETYWVTCAVSI